MYPYNIHPLFSKDPKALQYLIVTYWQEDTTKRNYITLGEDINPIITYKPNLV